AGGEADIALNGTSRSPSSRRVWVEEEREHQRTCVDLCSAVPERFLELRYRSTRPGMATADDDVQLGGGLALLPSPLDHFGSWRRRRCRRATVGTLIKATSKPGSAR